MELKILFMTLTLKRHLFLFSATLFDFCPELILIAYFIKHVLSTLCSLSLTAGFDGEQYNSDLQLLECKYSCNCSGLMPSWPPV